MNSLWVNEEKTAFALGNWWWKSQSEWKSNWEKHSCSRRLCAQSQCKCYQININCVRKFAEIVQFGNVLDAYSVSHLCGKSFLNFNFVWHQDESYGARDKTTTYNCYLFFIYLGAEEAAARVVCRFPELYIQNASLHEYEKLIKVSE